MGTQFSKIKVTQRVEVHGQVINDYYSYYNDSNCSDQLSGEIDEIYANNKTNSAADLGDLFTKRAHHSGVVSGHELLSYSFLGGQACEPRRSIRRKHRTRSSISLPRSTGGSGRTQFSSPSLKVIKNSPSIKYLTNPWSTAKEKLSLIIKKDVADHPDSELDSGISLNGNYDQIEPRNRKNAVSSDYERIEEIRTLQSKHFWLRKLRKKYFSSK